MGGKGSLQFLRGLFGFRFFVLPPDVLLCGVAGEETAFHHLAGDAVHDGEPARRPRAGANNVLREFRCIFHIL